MHDQPGAVVERGDAAERALAGGAVSGLVLAADVGHPVGRPEPFELVRDAGAVLDEDLATVVRTAHTWTRRRTASSTRAIASSTETPLSWSPFRYRKDTAPSSTSRSPAISMNGTFCTW